MFLSQQLLPTFPKVFIALSKLRVYNVCRGEMMIIDIGSRIKSLRNERKLTQSELSKVVNKMYGTNISKSMISKWENNKENPSMDHVRSLANFFNCSLDYLIGLDENKVAETQVESLATSELKKYFDENIDKLSQLPKDDVEKLIKMIDIYLG